jgi:AraC-like DNA-binding protein
MTRNSFHSLKWSGATLVTAIPLCVVLAAPIQDSERPFLSENQLVMDRMMTGMAQKPGDVDVDFAAMIIPHHQGAIDVAVLELRYRRNDQLRRIAQEIIVDQQQEIAVMRLALGQPLPPSALALSQVAAATAPAAPSIVDIHSLGRDCSPDFRPRGDRQDSAIPRAQEVAPVPSGDRFWSVIVQIELPGVVGTVAKLLEAAHRSVSLDPREAARCISEAAAVLGVEAVIPVADTAKISRSLARWQLNRALELFEANLDRPIRLREVADAVRLSASHFSRAFHKSMGEPPARYLRRQRVKRAQKMLLLTNKSITEIALNCGLSDQSHFTRTFRHVVGLPPAMWRRAFSDGSRASESAAPREYD